MGCCNPFNVFGVSSNAPNFLPIIDNGDTGLHFPYDVQGSYDAPGGGTGDKEIVPVVTPRISAGQFWMISAAMVPSSQPYAACEARPPTSSADERIPADKRWVVELCDLARHRVDSGTPDFHYIEGWRYCTSSRAICEDGEQRWVSYSLQSKVFGELSIQRTASDWHRLGSHAIVDIAAQQRVGFFDVEFLDNAFPMTAMESALRAIYPPGVFNVGSDFGMQSACNGLSFGREYFITSSYSPVASLPHTWRVGRVKYEGTRLSESPRMEVFTSDDLGDPLETYDGDYLVMLPWVRVSIDSSVEGTDECWVCAKTVTGDPKLVTGQYLNKVYRPGVGSEDESTGMADGTLTEAEVANVIVDAGNPSSQAVVDFPDEEWNDIRVFCYNRIWSFVKNENVDLLLFTTTGDEELATAEPFVTFEDESNLNPELDLNINSTDGMEFTSGSAVSGNAWIVDDGDAHDGNFSALCSDNKQFGGTTTLSVTVHVVDGATDIAFWYKHDNRRSAAMFPHALTNIPEVDNVLQFWVDGVKVLEVSNSEFTTETEFLDWYEHTETLAPGSHNLRWTHKRVWATNNPSEDITETRIDAIQFPEILVGEDITGRKRWYYNGEKVLKAEHWDWAQRDKEDETVLTGRVNTTPDFITVDYQDRILYGNPHAMVRLFGPGEQEGELDESFGDKGYIRFTSSPNIAKPAEEPCEDPDPTVIQPDQADDPRWGSFQILRIRHGFQLRGVNGHLRDATNLQIPLDDFQVRDSAGNLNREKFRSYLQSHGYWSERPNCWTVLDEGRRLIPHLEVVWRPNYEQPSWPDAPPYASPPYQSDFATSDESDDWGHYRPRDARKLAPGSELPRWSPNCWLVTATYSDSLAQSPQLVWVRFTTDPPNDPEDPEYWDPNWPPGSDVMAQGPWPSARWELVQARFVPTGIRQFEASKPISFEELCEYDDGGGPVQVFGAVWRIKFGFPTSAAFISWSDFDAIDCPCDCCPDDLPPVPPDTQLTT